MNEKYFSIRHKSSGKFILPYKGDEGIQNNTYLVIHSGYRDTLKFKFIPVDGHWGYIHHELGKKRVHPLGGNLFPDDGTDLVLNDAHHYGALFGIDTVNNEILHKGGRLAHPKDGSPNPEDNTYVTLNQKHHDAMKWEFVEPANPEIRVNVYGDPKITGHWKIINMVANPEAEHKKIMKHTESIKSELKFQWETLFGFQLKEFTMGVKSEESIMIGTSSATTWKEEQEATYEITVSKGQTVVTWQYVFFLEQHGHKSVFYSNILADTRSENDVPQKHSFYR